MSTKSPVSPSFPTFLDTDPYPSTPRDGRPVSAGSTTTTGTSDFGEDEFRTTSRGTTAVPSVTGPVGDVALPPSRPTAGATEAYSQDGRTALQPPTPRKGISRPNTATSRTHVPTLPAQTFFRPMSSQKLQAQRNGPLSNAEEGAAVAGASTIPEQKQSKHRHRYSDASVNTLRELQAARRDEDVPPLPTSRGTQVTRDGANTAGSINSVTPLQGQRSGTQNLDTGTTKSKDPQAPNGRSKSPRSLRASLGMASRTNKNEHDARPSPGTHEKLESHPSSSGYGEKVVAAQPSEPSKTAGKNYEYFAGNTLFCFAGRCMNTKARPLNALTFVLTTLPAFLFFGFSAPWLWHHLSPAIPIIFAYVFFLTISSFIHAAVSDPGILPRNMHPHPPNADEERDPLTVGPTTTEWVMVKTFGAANNAPVPQPGNEAGVGPTTAMEVPTKYCKTCNIWRPPRAHHCRVCDACMETQDHHCVWLNNCVGRRNYRYFFSYAGFGSVLAIFLLAFSATHISNYANHHNISFSQSLSGRTQERVAFAMILYSLLALPYPGSLFIYHLWLTARGETTREYLNSHKFPKKDRHRPFTQSTTLMNWVSTLLRPRPPTYMQFKRTHRPGDTRFGHAVPKRQRVKDFKGRYAVQGNGGRANGGPANGGGEVEMKQFSTTMPTGAQGGKAKPQAKSAGGVSGPVNSTPR